MLRNQYAPQNWKTFKIFTFALLAGISLIQTQNTFAANICREGLKELNKSQGVIQTKGGLWGYVEKSSNLKDQSILGLQIDGKLQRLIVSFENLCEEGKTPTPKLLGLISALLGDARMVFNKDPDRYPKEKMLETLNTLNKNIDKLLKQLPN